MKNISKVAFAASLASIAFGVPAGAADLLPVEEPVQPREFVEPAAVGTGMMDVFPVWSGLYVGLFAGGSIQMPEYDHTVTADDQKDNTEYPFFGGANIGGDFQNGALVIGAVADFAYHLSDGEKQGYKVDTADHSYTLSKKWAAGGRVRLGYAVGENILPYITGGAVYNAYEFNYDNSAGGKNSDAVDLNPLTWVAGGGVEFLATPSVSMFLEGLYSPWEETVDSKTTNASSLGSNKITISNQDITIKVGANFRLTDLLN